MALIPFTTHPLPPTQTHTFQFEFVFVFWHDCFLSFYFPTNFFTSFFPPNSSRPTGKDVLSPHGKQRGGREGGNAEVNCAERRRHTFIPSVDARGNVQKANWPRTNRAREGAEIGVKKNEKGIEEIVWREEMERDER